MGEEGEGEEKGRGRKEEEDGGEEKGKGREGRRERGKGKEEERARKEVLLVSTVLAHVHYIGGWGCETNLPRIASVM